MIFEALLAAIFDPDLKDDFNTMGIFDIQIKCKILDLLNSITEKPNKNDINLEEEAEKLDTKLREMQSRMIIEESFWGRKIKNKYFSFINYYRTQGILDDKLINDSNQITFKGRFNEVRNIAKINKIIYALLVENNEKILEICIDDIQKSLDNFTYINKAHLRFEILKDFIWLFTGSIILKEKLQENLNNEIITFTNLNKNLLNHENVSEELRLLINEAKSFEKLALEYKFLPLRSMEQWLHVKSNYEKARDVKIDKDVPDEIIIEINLGYARACLKLAKYSKVLEFIKANKSNRILIGKAEFWQIGSIAHRKLGNYLKADRFIEQALKIQPNNGFSNKESDIIKNLILQNTDQYVKSTKKKNPAIVADDDYYSRVHENKIKYNILSVDGGGVRGIVPCVWLNEIENRTKKPISHMFNMMAGTSTGAIISSALSVPDVNKKPKFSASDILQIYVDNSSTIFSEKKSSLFSLFQSRYATFYKGFLMDSFEFKKFYVSNSLTDLVVPAIKKEYLNKTYIFSSYDAKIEKNKNFSLYDVLMSTTAAPMY